MFLQNLKYLKYHQHHLFLPNLKILQNLNYPKNLRFLKFHLHHLFLQNLMNLKYLMYLKYHLLH